MQKSKELSLHLRKNMVDAHLKGNGYTAVSKHFAVSNNRCMLHHCQETQERKIFRDVNNPRISASSTLDVSRKSVVIFILVGFVVTAQ